MRTWFNCDTYKSSETVPVCLCHVLYGLPAFKKYLYKLMLSDKWINSVFLIFNTDVHKLTCGTTTTPSQMGVPYTITTILPNNTPINRVNNVSSRYSNFFGDYLNGQPLSQVPTTTPTTSGSSSGRTNLHNKPS